MPKISPRKLLAQSPSTETPSVTAAPDNQLITQFKSENNLEPNKPNDPAPHAEEQVIETYIEKSPIIEQYPEEKIEIKSEIKQEIQEESEPAELVEPQKPKDTSSEPLVIIEESPNLEEPSKTEEPITSPQNNNNVAEIKTEDSSTDGLENADMTASMIAKIRITTEEEAKAALAERRRLAREEAERQALAEKLRILQEEERQRQEEEQLRLLAEEQRKAEEERLAQVCFKCP